MGLRAPSGGERSRSAHPAPTGTLDLKVGELVRVKSHAEILATINTHNLHRGLLFDVEMVPYCGHVYRVRARVERFIDEKTGRMKSLKSPAVILEGVSCTSRFSKCRMFCPRGLHSWWREEWLERVSEAAIGEPDPAPCKTLPIAGGPPRSGAERSLRTVRLKSLHDAKLT